MRTHRHAAAVFAVILAPLLADAAPAQEKQAKLGTETVAIKPSNPLQDLPGRWVGSGVAELSNGHREPFNCIVTYIVNPGVNPGQAELKQGFRCESPNVKVSTSTVMQVTGGALAGTWQEKNFEKTGRVSGTMTPDGITATVVHQQRQAQVQIATKECDQVIEVTTRPGDTLRSIVAHLKRC
jgi:hypothetical protein